MSLSRTQNQLIIKNYRLLLGQFYPLSYIHTTFYCFLNNKIPLALRSQVAKEDPPQIVISQLQIVTQNSAFGGWPPAAPAIFVLSSAHKRFHSSTLSAPPITFSLSPLFHYIPSPTPQRPITIYLSHFNTTIRATAAHLSSVALEKLDEWSQKFSNIFKYFQTFRIIFRIFSNIFKRFQTFLLYLSCPIVTA